MMYIPIYKKIYFSPEAFIERTLPRPGEILVKENESVSPVSRLGITKVSYSAMPIDGSLKLAKGKTEDGYFYKGERLGRVGLKYVVAPFNGYLSREKVGYIFKQEDRDYRLMAGVWGKVQGVVKERSTLIKTQFVDIPFTFCTPGMVSGELVVFPNPTEILELQYLEHFTKGAEDKVIYVGGYASEAFLEAALNKGVSAVVAGGADKASYKFAEKHKMFLGGFNGFGYLPVVDFVYDFLKDVSSRYVFVDGSRGLLRIPVPVDFTATTIRSETNTKYKHLIKVEPGLKVQVFVKPYVGWFGEIEEVQDYLIYVKLYNTEEKIEVSIPNVLAVA